MVIRLLLFLEISFIHRPYCHAKTRSAKSLLLYSTIHNYTGIVKIRKTYMSSSIFCVRDVMSNIYAFSTFITYMMSHISSLLLVYV